MNLKLTRQVLGTVTYEFYRDDTTDKVVHVRAEPQFDVDDTYETFYTNDAQPIVDMTVIGELEAAVAEYERVKAGLPSA